MNRLCLTQSKDTTRRNIDQLTSECDAELLTWKTNLEVNKFCIDYEIIETCWLLKHT